MPLVQVRRCLAKLLSLAERKATKTEVSVGRSEGPGDELFKTDDEFEKMIAQMDAHSRSAQMSQATIWKRQAELAGWTMGEPENELAPQPIEEAVAAAPTKSDGGGDRRTRNRRNSRDRNGNSYDGGGHGGGSGGGTGGGGNDGGYPHGGNSNGAEEVGSGSDGNVGGSGGGSSDSSTRDRTEDSGSGSDDNAGSSDREEDSGYVSPAALQVNSEHWLGRDYSSDGSGGQEGEQVQEHQSANGHFVWWCLAAPKKSDRHLSMFRVSTFK